MAIHVYSTGPVENHQCFGKKYAAKTASILVLNNSRRTIKFQVRTYGIKPNANWKKMYEVLSFTLKPHSKQSTFTDVSRFAVYEIQVVVHDKQRRGLKNDVLISIFGKNAADRFVASHRFVHSELTRLQSI
jgi:hypothetical protein